MVKAVMSTILSVVVADEVTSLMQLSAGVRMSQGQRILAAVAKGDDTICVQAAAGDVAPVTGSFTARASQQAVVVAAGSMAEEAGSFCVSKQDVLLIQRTLGLNTAGDFEAALGSKKKKKAKWLPPTFDFKGNPAKLVWVYADGCPNVEAGLVQTVDASVSDKKGKKEGKNKLDDDQLKVCGCRNFLKDSVNMPGVVETVKMALEGPDGDKSLLQMSNFDAALASKKAKKAKTTTTTTAIDFKGENLAKACLAVMELGRNDWTEAARQLNNREHAELYKSFNITGGWQHCDKSWVVRGACSKLSEKTPEETPEDAQRPATLDEDTDAAMQAEAEEYDISCAQGTACRDKDDACVSDCNDQTRSDPSADENAKAFFRCQKTNCPTVNPVHTDYLCRMVGC